MNEPGQGAAAAVKKIRAFIALKTPPDWDQKLTELQRDLKQRFESRTFRWVNPEQIHITLRFFGWLSSAHLDEVTSNLAQIATAHQPFTLTCGGLGCFPNPNRPRVFWAGLSGDLAEAASLQREISAVTHNFGEPPEGRPFKPHLTLARLKEPQRQEVSDLQHVVERGFKIESTWRIDEILLMQSHLSPQGSQYETLARCKIGA